MKGSRRPRLATYSEDHWPRPQEVAFEADELKRVSARAVGEAEIADQHGINDSIHLRPNCGFHPKKLGWFCINEEDAVLDTIAVGFQRLCDPSSAGVVSYVVRDDETPRSVGSHRVVIPRY